MPVVNDSGGQTVPTPPATSGEVGRDQFQDAAGGMSAALTYSIIGAPNGTFGYVILSDGKLLIRQTNLPGQSGVEGCRSKADAEKLAAFVVKKIQKGEMPPTVTTDELEQLDLLP